jgi:quinol monooxygenase YgiN
MAEAIVVGLRRRAGMLRYWLHHDDDDPAHILLYEQCADRGDFDASLGAAWRRDDHADTGRLWEKPRVITVYRRIPAPWEPLDDDGLPRSPRN